VRKTFDIGGKNYIFDFDYNTRGDFYTIAIYDTSETLLYSGKLPNLQNLITGPIEGLDISVRLIPVNIEDAMRDYPAIDRIGSVNFDTMRICIA
jgi:hypothetical protein